MRAPAAGRPPQGMDGDNAKMILTRAQAGAAHQAMQAVNAVQGRLRVLMGESIVMELPDGTILVSGAGGTSECYDSPEAFAEAYGVGGGGDCSDTALH